MIAWATSELRICSQDVDKTSEPEWPSLRGLQFVEVYKCWREYGEKGLLHCWWKRQLAQPLWKTVWQFLRKLKIELLHDPAIPLLGTYLDKNLIQKDTRVLCS